MMPIILSVVLILIIAFIWANRKLTLKDLLLLKNLDGNDRQGYLKKRRFNHFQEGGFEKEYQKYRVLDKPEYIAFLGEKKSAKNLESYLRLTKKEQLVLTGETDYISYGPLARSKYIQVKRKIISQGFKPIIPDVEIENQLSNYLSKSGNEDYPFFDKNMDPVEIFLNDSLKIQFKRKKNGTYSIMIYDSKIFYTGTYTVFNNPSINPDIVRAIKSAIREKYIEETDRLGVKLLVREDGGFIFGINQNDPNEEEKIKAADYLGYFQKNFFFVFPKEIYPNEYLFLIGKIALRQSVEDNELKIEPPAMKDKVLQALEMSQHEKVRVRFLADSKLNTIERLGTYIDPPNMNIYLQTV